MISPLIMYYEENHNLFKIKTFLQKGKADSLILSACKFFK